MNYSDEEMDELLKKYASEQKINLPQSYVEMVNNRIGQGRPKKYFYISKGLVACLCFMFLLIGGVGVNAAINYALERMEGISEEEKQSVLEDLQNSSANVDTFTREFTDEELERIQSLLVDYETKGVFPKGKVLEITSERELDSESICFLAETSTFYLPERELLDEELLELIEFYYVREYTLEAESEVVYDMEGVNEISKEEALIIAEEVVRKVYGIGEALALKNEDYQQGDDGITTFSTLYLNLSVEDSEDEFLAVVDMQDGRVGIIEWCNETENYANDVLFDEYLIKEKFIEANTMAKQYLEMDQEWKEVKAICSVSESGAVENGVVNFYFCNNISEGCIVSYSVAQNEMYKVRFFTEEALNEKLVQENADKSGNTQVEIKFD